MLWSSSPTAVKRPRSPAMQLHQLVLDAVRVLVFVDEDVAQARAPGVAHFGVVAAAGAPAGRSGRRSRRRGRPRGAPRSAASRARRRSRRRRCSPPCSPESTSASAAADARPRFFQAPIAHCQRRASALSVVPPASFSTPRTSSLSRMLKLGGRPSASPCSRRMRTPSEWKVLIASWRRRARRRPARAPARASRPRPCW